MCSFEFINLTQTSPFLGKGKFSWGIASIWLACGSFSWLLTNAGKNQPIVAVLFLKGYPGPQRGESWASQREHISKQLLFISALLQVLRTLFNSFLSRMFLFWRVEWKRLFQEPSISLLLSYESEVINATAKEASLPITASSSTDHGHPHGFQGQRRSQTSICLQGAAAGKTILQYGFQWQYG